MKINRWLPFLCIMIGASLLLYPLFKDKLEMDHQQQILQEWQVNVEHVSLDSEPEVTTKKQTSVAPIKASVEGVEGELVISKINLKLPILKDATPSHLNVSVATIEPTGKLDRIGNYVIAGHRSRKYGKNFNRLDELTVGDQVDVYNGQKLYRFVIDNKKIVQPTQLDVLKSDGKTHAITLITCTPGGKKRLVVHGMLKEFFETTK